MMVGLERPQGQPRIFTHPANTNEPSMYDPEITVEGEDAVQADMGGDACCIDAKNKWIEELRPILGIPEGEPYDIPPGGYKYEGESLETTSIIYRYEQMDCEEFRRTLEDFAGVMPGKLYQNNVIGRRPFGLAPTPEHFLAKRILEEWDMCEAKSTFGDNLDIYASSDAFEAGWNAILKSRGQYHG